MGSYDDGQFRSTRKPGAGPGSAFKWMAVVVVSALVGAGATLVAVPYIIQNDIISSPNLASSNLQSTGAPTDRSVSVNINDAIEQAVRKVTPTVVGVINMQMAQNSSGNGESLQPAGVGSGVIFDPRGYIVTNNHVVEGADKVEVVLDDKRHVYATVVGTDAYTDLAVIKIPQSYVSAQNVAQFGDSSVLQPAEPAFAIGNPAGLDFSDSVTVGVISATERTMPVQDEATGQQIGQETVLQTDAAINPGNSGGPLCNIAGQVIGINSAKIVAQGFEGMGFAIPINEVRVITQQIVATGHAEHPALGILGESLSNVPQEYQPHTPVNYGVWVAQVVSSQAKAAGLKKGDVIVDINGVKIEGFSDISTILSQNFHPGQYVNVTVYRGQQKLVYRLQLSELPPYRPQASTSSGSSGGGSGGSFVFPDPFSGGSSGGFPFP